MTERSVPVVVDDRKDGDGFRATRAAYYYVEAIEPLPDVSLDFLNLGSTLIPLELTGVILGPVGTSDYFESPEMLEELFDAVESQESLIVDSDDIWIPNQLFDRPPARGHIFRVPIDLFLRLYSLCRHNAILDESAAGLTGEGTTVRFSSIETEAFARWAEAIVAKAMDVHPKNADLALSRGAE